MTDSDTPPPSPVTSPVLRRVRPHASASTTPSLPSSQESLYEYAPFDRYLARGNMLERELERLIQGDRESAIERRVPAYQERDMLAMSQADRERVTSANIWIRRTPHVESSRYSTEPTIREKKGEDRVAKKRGDRVKKTPEAEKDRPDDYYWKQLEDAVRAQELWEALLEDMKMSLMKMTELKLAAEDANNENDKEWERVEDPEWEALKR